VTKNPSYPSASDVHSPEIRSYNMSRVRGRDTRPEMLIRRGLHARGYRFRVQVRGLPGRPDLLFQRQGVVLFVHGCFWHGHDCPLFRLPATRTEFWATKIETNRERDARAVEALRALGWRAMTIWECALRGRARRPAQEVLQACEVFLTGAARSAEISGDWCIRGGIL
jgi:DNA mismatch endonuclease, patch repair protein